MTAPVNDPMVAAAQAVRLLSGLSGAYVYLLTLDSRNWFVRKASAAPEANERLRRQKRKQDAWRQNSNLPLRVPQVLGEGEIAGRYFFDMEVVRGVDGVTYLRTADYAAVRRFTDRMCAYLQSAAAAAPLCSHQKSQDLFQSLYSRVCEVQRVTRAIPADALTAVFLGLERLRAIPDAGPTLCHGDLTLENIVVDADESVWVLDLLDAPHEHYWLDVAKLHQDLDGGWYGRREKPIARCTTEFVSRRLLDTVHLLAPRYHALHPVLMACTFIRILPYVRDDVSQRFVQDRINYFATSISSRADVEDSRL